MSEQEELQQYNEERRDEYNHQVRSEEREGDFCHEEYDIIEPEA